MVRIESITRTNGEILQPGNLTVLVGPNNGGKSRFLRDLVTAFGNIKGERKAIGSVVRSFRGGRYPLQEILQSAVLDPNGNHTLDVLDPTLGPSQQRRVSPHTFQLALTTGEVGPIFEWLHQRHIAYLKTENRLAILKKQVNKTGEFQGPGSLIEMAWDARERISEDVKRKVQAAFGFTLELRLRTFAELEYVLGGADGTISELLDDQGDGIRSFCAILIAMMVLDRSIILVDEPEAFLHPPQAYLIGRALAEQAGPDKQLFIATHSADVLRGILSVTNDVQILRLSRRNSGFQVKRLDIDALKRIIADPLLSSSRVLDGLFYNGVIITESDGDVILYRTLLEKLETTASIHFVNAYSKLQASKVAVPYRAMDVPFTAVLDFDILSAQGDIRQVLTELGGDWSSVLPIFQQVRQSILQSKNDPISIEERLQKSLGTLFNSLDGIAREASPEAQLNFFKHRLNDARSELSEWEKLKASGINGLSEIGKRAFANLDTQCRSVGLFIVPVGEREAWLAPDIPYTKNKRKWTQDAINYFENSHPAF